MTMRERKLKAYQNLAQQMEETRNGEAQAEEEKNKTRIKYPIKIAEYNSSEIRGEAKRLGILHMREIGSWGEGDDRIILLGLPFGGRELRVIDTNGSPVWEEGNESEFREFLATRRAAGR